MKTDIGYYQVAGKGSFNNKFEAILAAQESNAEVKWNFFNDVLQTIEWRVEPITPLDEFYRIRATQIRNAYDYVIVFCSGGADSNNVIRTFMNNNIHVDEVIGLAPESGLKNWDFDKSDTSETNTATEIKYAMYPILQEVSTRCPATKVTINDYFEEVTGYKDENWVFDACGNIVTVLTSHFTDVKKFKHIDKIIQSGKRVALVYGTDKPVLRIAPDNKVYFVLGDAGVNYLNMPSSRELPNVDRVLFYWTPDLPEMMVKQAHVAAKAVYLPEHKYIRDAMTGDTVKRIVGNVTFEQRVQYQAAHNMKVTSKDDVLSKYLSPDYMFAKDSSWAAKSVYQRMIVPFIYPTTYTKDLYQCQKVDADAGFFTKDQSWIHALHRGTSVSETLLAGTRMLHRSIHPRYLNMNGTGFLNYYNVYEIGNESNFYPQGIIL